MGKNEIRRETKGCDYFFVKPTKNSDVHVSAKRLMRIDGVMEVSITEGAYGFIVKAEQAFEEHDLLDKKITDTVGGSTRKLVCHCQYGKGQG